jgi:hypothetical protein
MLLLFAITSAVRQGRRFSNFLRHQIPSNFRYIRSCRQGRKEKRKERKTNPLQRRNFPENVNKNINLSSRWIFYLVCVCAFSFCASVITRDTHCAISALFAGTPTDEKASINFKQNLFYLYSKPSEGETRGDVDSVNFRCELSQTLHDNIEHPATGSSELPRNIPGLGRNIRRQRCSMDGENCLVINWLRLGLLLFGCHMWMPLGDKENDSMRRVVGWKGLREGEGRFHLHPTTGSCFVDTLALSHQLLLIFSSNLGYKTCHQNHHKSLSLPQNVSGSFQLRG